GDTAAADEYLRLFRNGSKWIDENLFNGEYYIQKVQGIPKENVAKGLIVGMGAANTEKPDFQVGDGCLLDQLSGQYLADLAGLGDGGVGTHGRAQRISISRGREIVDGNAGDEGTDAFVLGDGHRLGQRSGKRRVGFRIH